MSEDFLDSVRREFALADTDIRAYSPLTLAFIGDAVFDLIIRTIVVMEGNCAASKLHKKASHIVNATTQAMIAEAIKDELSEEERAIFRRGQNAKSATKAKNSTAADYHKATGLEALVGYLYLAGLLTRAISLVRGGLQKLDAMDARADTAIESTKP